MDANEYIECDGEKYFIKSFQEYSSVNILKALFVKDENDFEYNLDDEDA
jgi:hypothetical protein